MLSLPKFSYDLATFVADLRSWVFTSQSGAARHFNVSHTTISRYENGHLKPSLEYMVDLVRLLRERLRTGGQDTEDVLQILTLETNQAISTCYPGESLFRNWRTLFSEGLEYEYDVYVSYSHTDRAWVRDKLLPVLEAQGLVVLVDFRGFRPGVPSLIETDRALRISRRFLLVITPNYLQSAWAEFEALMAQTLDVFNRTRRVIPLILEKSELPPRLASLTSVDVTDSVDERRSWDTLMKSLQVSSVQWNRVDWSEAPTGNPFFGRHAELSLLKHWITTDGCRLIGVLGMGGIGKTALTTKVAMQLLDEFDYVFWRSLRNAMPIDEFLREAIQFFFDQLAGELPDDPEKLISVLLDLLRKNRCLLVMDNVEAILKEGEFVGAFRVGYETYGRLIERLGESQHQSCLVLNSREKPKQLARLEGETLPVRTLTLRGLEPDDGWKLLEDRGLRGSEDFGQEVVRGYSGNPLALQLVAETIREMYAGDLGRFLREGTPIFRDIQDVLDEQFLRLSSTQRNIILWLAIEREPVSLDVLYNDVLQSVLRLDLLDAMTALRKRSLVELGGPGFTLQNVVMEYVTNRFVDQVCREIESSSVKWFNTHALEKAQSKDYVRQSQIRLIVSPVATRVHGVFGSKQAVLHHLMKILATVRGEISLHSGYTAGNILNLLSFLDVDLTSCDFSSVPVLQAYLQGITLHNVDFRCAELSTCVFAQTFCAVLTVAFDPEARMLAAGTMNGEIRVWETGEGKPLFAIRGHTDYVRSLAFSPDGKTLVTAGEDRSIRLWDVTTGQCIKEMQGHTDRIWSVLFSLDGRFVISGSDDATVRLWDIETGDCTRVLTGHTDWIWAVAISSDGKTIASGSCDRTIRLWDSKTGQCLSVLRGHVNRVRSVALSADGRTLASCSEGNTIRLWNVDTGECTGLLHGHASRVRSLAFSGTGSALASAGDDQSIRIWDIETGQCIKTLHGHSNWINAVTFDQKGQLCASGSSDQTIRLWEVRTGQCLSVLHGYSNWAMSIAVDPKDEFVVCGYEDQKLRLWEISSRNCVCTLEGHTNWVWSTCFSPDGRTIASSSGDRTIGVWDIQTEQCLHVLHGHSGSVRSVAFSSDGRTLGSGSEDGTVRLWDVRHGQCLRVLKGHNGRVWSVEFHPTASIIASGSDDATIRLWTLGPIENHQALTGHSNAVWSVAFDHQGNILASGGDDRTVRLWNVHNGRCARVYEGHTGRIWSVHVSPDGRFVASGSDDETIRLWSMQTGECVRVLRGHDFRVRSVKFNSKGNQLISASDDGDCRLWNVDTGECLAQLRAERPYERMNIAGAIGLTAAQRISLLSLGAIEL